MKAEEITVREVADQTAIVLRAWLDIAEVKELDVVPDEEVLAEVRKMAGGLSMLFTMEIKNAVDGKDVFKAARRLLRAREAWLEGEEDEA